MADQQVQNDEAFDLISVLAVVAPRAKDAVEYYIKHFGAVELKRRSVKKRKAGQDKPLLQVLLQFGSGMVLVVDRLEEDFENHRNSCDFQMVYEGNPKPAVWTVEKMGGGGDTVVTQGVDVMEDFAFEHSGKKALNTIVNDPFGIHWTIAGKKIIILPYLGTSSSDNTSTGAGSEDTTAGTAAKDDDNSATKNGSNDSSPADTTGTSSIDTTKGLMID